MKGDEKDVLKRIRGLEKQAIQLMSMIDGPPLRGPKLFAAQERMRTLKASLRSEFEAGNTDDGKAAMTQPERDVLWPAVQHALSRIERKKISSPTEAQWHTQLYSCIGDLNYYRRQLSTD
jgi:hypothetical protein